MKNDAKSVSGRRSELMLSSNEICAVFAHEIGNPLNGVFTTLQLLERRLCGKPDSVDEATADLLRNLRGEIKRLMLLLDQLRSLPASPDMRWPGK